MACVAWCGIGHQELNPCQHSYLAVAGSMGPCTSHSASDLVRPITRGLKLEQVIPK